MYKYQKNNKPHTLFVIFTLFDIWNLNTEGLKWLKIFLQVVNLLPFTLDISLAEKVIVDYGL